MQTSHEKRTGKDKGVGVTGALPTTSTTTRLGMQETRMCFKKPTSHQMALWVPKATLIAHGYYQGKKQIWVSKSSCKYIQDPALKVQVPTPISKEKKHSRKTPVRRSSGKGQDATNNVLRWVPKNLLKAQGYYKGNTQLWLPKKKLATQQAPRIHIPYPSRPSTTAESKPFQSKPSRTTFPQMGIQNSTQKWVVRADYNKKKYAAIEELPQPLFKPPSPSMLLQRNQ